MTDDIEIKLAAGDISQVEIGIENAFLVIKRPGDDFTQR